jgi:pyruvate/2-oxoglutarate dehydrogenase complex dihydrolipoamide dehydrogenase (E3) component
VRILRWSFRENDRAQTERQAEGFVKLVTTTRGRLLGATVVGPHAGEQIALLTLAIRQRLGVRDLAGMTFAYPTLSEAIKRAAITFYAGSLTKPALRRILAWLRKLG